MAEKQIVWNKENENINMRQWWLQSLLVSVLQLFLVWGSSRLMHNIFGLQDVTTSVKFKLLMLFSILAICFWNAWSGVTQQRRKRLVGNLALLLGISLLLFLAYRGEGDTLVNGFQVLGNTYIRRWNAQSREYYLLSSYAAVLQPTIEFLLVIVMLLMQAIGGIVRKHRIVLAVPISIISIGLLVMAIPRWSDLTILLVSGMLLIYFDNCDSIAWKRLLVLAVGVLLLTSVAGGYQEDAEKQMLSMNGDWFNFWENLGESIAEEIDDFELPEWSVNKDIIDNKPPNFDEEQVILLTMSEKPVRSVYLRGYHCKDYADGAWNKDTGAFEEACKKYGINQEVAAEKLILFQYEQENILDNRQVVYELSDMDTGDNYCYLPYGIGWEETPENCELIQDYIVKRKTGSKGIKVLGWQQLYHLDASVNVTEEYSLFQEWYNDYAYENYLTVADNQKAVRQLANEMSGDSRFAPYMLYLDAKRYSHEEVNASRLQVAYLVAEWLRAQGTYSLELDKLPLGADTIEYFLENSKEGFCEHFASAGTLILRELGVPARYARGYIVKTGVVKASGDEYIASVLDSYAHAWTEIYLENYGWVPIEMTPGYSGSNITLEPETTATPEPNDMQNPPEDTEQDVQEIPTEAPKDEEATGNEEMPGEDVSEKDGLGGSEDDPEKDISNVVGKFLLAVVLLAFVAGLAFVGYRYWIGNKGRSKKRLAGYMRRGDTRKAVKWINGEIYRQLVHKGHKFRRLSDGEFLTALKSEFPEVEESRWDAYFAVVRKAAYSADRISAEEARECLDLYKVVWQSSRKR